MASKTEICNYALALVAIESISSVDAATEPARLCKLHLEQTTREVLRMAYWRSCRRRAALVLNTQAPAFGWAKSYPLPVDWLRMVSFNECDPDNVRRVMFEVEGRELLTDEGSARIVYIRDITLESAGGSWNAMDPLLTKAVYTALAAKLAWPMQQSRTLADSLNAQVVEYVKQAKTINARDAFEPVQQSGDGSSWIPARVASTNG